MATKLYLPASGTSPLNSLADSTYWWAGAESCFYRAPCSTSKSNTALANKSFSTSGAGLWSVAQFVSAPFDHYHFTTSDYVSLVVKGHQASVRYNAALAFSLRVVSNDGSTARGSLKDAVDGEELSNTACTRVIDSQTVNALACTAGDRLVVEVGIEISYEDLVGCCYLAFGDPTATADFAATSGLTTDLCPWFSLSPTLTFWTPPSLSTSQASNIGATGATSGGVISASGGGAFSDAGVCYSTSTLPTLADSHVHHASPAVETFAEDLSGLSPDTLYHTRAFATTSEGTTYGAEEDFTTLATAKGILKAGNRIW